MKPIDDHWKLIEESIEGGDETANSIARQFFYMGVGATVASFRQMLIQGKTADEIMDEISNMRFMQSGALQKAAKFCELDS